MEAMAAQLKGLGFGALAEEVLCAFAVSQEKRSAANERLDLLEGLDRGVGEVRAWGCVSAGSAGD